VKTFQDLQSIGLDENSRMDFCMAAINEHKSSPMYKTAFAADLYYRHMNPTIMQAQKMVYDAMGRAVPDIWSANNKIPSNYYAYFITQAVQYLLGNGVSFGKEGTKDRLGENFDGAVMQAATKAKNGGVSFGFWNNDHLEVFGIYGGVDDPAFVPLYDEENGALRAGIRFWQIADNKPLRFTLYEEDGLTEYIKRKSEDAQVLIEKHDYIQIRETSEATGTAIYNGGNYPGFPIVPLFNVNKQSEIVGNREIIDAFDLMASDLINNTDEGNLIYWLVKNAGGMDQEDLNEFISTLKRTHVASINGDAGQDLTAHSVETPYAASDTALEHLRTQLFDAFMALDTKNIAGGAVTATQIMAAYEPLNSKTDLFEYQVTAFILGILRLIGIDDIPTYTRSKIVNTTEEIQNIAALGTDLPQEYRVRKILELMGDTDKVQEVLELLAAEDMNRYNGQDETDDQEEDMNG
jgi:hypothetical protein